MHFNSYIYIIIFLPLTLFLFYLLPKNKYRTFFIIIASYVFYGWGNTYICFLLFLSSFWDFFIGKKLNELNEYLETSKTITQIKTIKNKKIFFLNLSIFLNIGLLVIFKYWDWLIDWAILKNSSCNFMSINIPIARSYYPCAVNSQIIYDFGTLKHYLDLPPGISFYTFQTLSYTIDIYRNNFKPMGKFSHYLAYVAFFPQLIAGPIERAGNLLPQIVFNKKFISKRIIQKSFFLIFFGLFKKIVIADNLGHIVDECYKNIQYSGIGFILAFGFAFQIYCDFSAYTDIARGTARLFGIKIMRNFLTPYFSQNPSEFWRRWHISLSQWIRDYVYISLGGNKKGNVRTILNLLITMFLAGLWHGAGIFFIIWGIYNAFLLLIYKVFPIDKFLINIFGCFFGKIYSILLMFILTLYGWVFFWSQASLTTFFSILKSFNQVIFLFFKPYVITEKFYELLFGVLIFTIPIILADYISYKCKKEFSDIQTLLSTTTKTILYLIMFYCMLFFGYRGSLQFIYFQF